MKVLVACEESQAVTKEFRAKGHEAYSCDIQECSGGHPEWHCREDVVPLLNGNCKFKTCDGKEHEIKGKWDMVIAFPPCFVAGTKVMTYDGLKNIEDVKVSDKVLTHKGRFRKVKEVMKKQILYYQKHPEEFLELMGHDLHLYWYQKLWLKFLAKIGR